MMRFGLQCVAATLTLVLSFSAYAQEIPTLSERIEVRVVSIDVVVTDRAGQPITGLTQNDFELLEDKVARPIVNFYESTPAAFSVSAAEAATATPSTATAAVTGASAPRRVVFYIDNATLTSVERNRLIQEMKKFVAESMRPGDEAMVATFNNLLRMPLHFTADRALVAEALDRVATEAAGGDRRRREAALAQQDIAASGQHEQRIWLAKAYAQTALNDLQQSVKAAKMLMNNLAGLEGKKMMVVASEGFVMHPGLEMFQFIDKLGDQVTERDMIQSMPTRGRTNDSPPPRPSMPAMTKMKRSAQIDSQEFESHKLVESIASAANANGVTLYTIHGGAIDGGVGAESDRAQPITRSVLMSARWNAEAGLKSLAELTGGLASVTAARHHNIFERLSRELDSYYSLGYRPAPGTGERTIQVRLKKGGRHLVRTRRTHVQKSLEQDMSDRVVANLFKPLQGDLNVTITTAAPVPQADGKMLIPAKIHVPMDSLTLLEQNAGGLAGGFDVFVVAVDAGGSLSSVWHRTQKVNVAPEEKETAKGKTFTYSIDLLMNRDIVRVSAAIVDSTSNVASFARYDR